MKRLRVSKQKLNQLAIVYKYETDPHAYGYCSKCNAIHDYWKYGKVDYMCPNDCGTKLRTLSLSELAETLDGCEKAGCFNDTFLQVLPLMPKLKGSEDS